MPTAEQYDAQYENDDMYKQGIPAISDERLAEIYKSAGIGMDGLPVKRGLATGKVVSGGPVIISASTHALKQAALKCGCPSCLNALENIGAAVMWRTTSPEIYHHRWARANRAHFIQRLREVVFSQTVQHNHK